MPDELLEPGLKKVYRNQLKPNDVVVVQRPEDMRQLEEETVAQIGGGRCRR